MWKDSYLVGIELIDTQHKRLFKAIDSLKGNLGQPDKTHYKKQLYDITAFLKDYCHTHFSDEQKYMQSIGFEGYEEHMQKHDKLLDTVTDYRNNLVKTNFENHVVESFLGFLATWLIYHIGVEDQQIPKQEQPDIPEQEYAETHHEYADNIKAVLNILAGLSEQSINLAVDNKHLDSGVCYRVNLINAKDHKNIGFVFSNSLAYGLVKEMTSIDATEFIHVMYSALQEISAIIGAKIAGLLSREIDSDISIEIPKHALISDINKTKNSLVLNTQLGAMEVFIN
jgi:hemerythrin-like metal-binding protein